MAHGLLIQNHEDIWKYDRTGRFVSFIQRGKAVRRGLDHRMVESVQVGHGDEAHRLFRELPNAEKEDLIARGIELVTALAKQLAGDGQRTWLDTISQFTYADLLKDQARFRRAYLPVSILPPDQYQALVVQVSEGCSYNKCTFCDFYQGRTFHIKNEVELEAHIQSIRSFFGDRLADRNGFFLGDGNALIVPYEKLCHMMEQISGKLGDVGFHDQFTTFMDTFNLDRKSLTELRDLNRRGLKTVYVGLESGSAALRAFLNKPGSPDEAIEAIVLLKQAGFQVGVIVLLGAGGLPFAEDHEQETLQALARIPFTKGDIVYLSPFIEPHNPSYGLAGSATRSESFSQKELTKMFWTMKHKLADIAPVARVSLYSILQHLY